MWHAADDGSAHLVGARCARCATLAFPAPHRCAACGHDRLDEATLGATGGALYGWTAVNAAPPGYDGPVPYGFGVVEVDEGLRVITRLTVADPDVLEFGQRMRCVADPDVASWAFAPEAP